MCCVCSNKYSTHYRIICCMLHIFCIWTFYGSLNFISLGCSHRCNEFSCAFELWDAFLILIWISLVWTNCTFVYTRISFSQSSLQFLNVNVNRSKLWMNVTSTAEATFHQKLRFVKNAFFRTMLKHFECISSMDCESIQSRSKYRCILLYIQFSLKSFTC